MIAGYADEPSAVTGERMVLRVSTDAPAFRVLAYRWGRSRNRWAAGVVRGVDRAQRLPFAQ